MPHAHAPAPRCRPRAWPPRVLLARLALAVALIATGGAALPGRAQQPAPAAAGEARLRCESQAGAENFCAARVQGGVRLVGDFGSTQCREGSTWRHDARGIYVRNGCRGEFAYRSSDGGGWGNGSSGWNDASVEVRCNSNDGREQFCPIDNRGVTLRKQESRAACVEGESWRADRRGVYVRNGCRAVFVARQGNGGKGDGWAGSDGNAWGGGGSAYAIKCQSIGGRWGACPVDIGGPVRLLKQESHAECTRGWTWGVLGREAIWVSDGCRAVFEVMNGRAATGRKAYDGAGDAPPGITRRKEE